MNTSAFKLSERRLELNPLYLDQVKQKNFILLWTSTTSMEPYTGNRNNNILK